MKNIKVLIGNFGSGKTELALNFAVELSKLSPAVFVDLDVVNPYFRATERKDVLDAAHVKLIHPNFALTTVDVPSLPPEIFSVFIDAHEHVIFDVGGDPTGAKALGQYKHNFDSLPEGSVEVLLVVNPRRPFSAEAGMVTDMLNSIMSCSRLQVTGLINNCNLARETSVSDLIDGYDILREVSISSGIPVRYTSGVKPVLDKFMQYAAEKRLESAYIGEPLHINTYMHRDWESFCEKGV